MKFGRSLIFVIIVDVLFSAVAFPQNGNLSDDTPLVMHEYNKSVKSLSLLSDDPSPGQQDGMDVEFVGKGPINLTLDYDLIFKIPSLKECNGKVFGICFDSFYAPDKNSRHFCSPSQCYLKLHLAENGFPSSENSNWDGTLDHVEKSVIFSLKSSASACKPKTENGMIQMKVISYSCRVEAKSAQIKYPEIPSTTVKSLTLSDDTASASLWYQSWWFILIIICIFIALILGVAAGVLFYFRKKRNTSKTPPKPSPFADAPTIETLFQESERREQLKAVAAQKKKNAKKNDGKAKKKAAAPPKAKTPRLSGKNPYGGDDTQDYLDIVKSNSYSNKS